MASPIPPAYWVVEKPRLTPTGTSLAVRDRCTTRIETIRLPARYDLRVLTDGKSYYCEVLGRGGFGLVVPANDECYADRQVAIKKVLNPFGSLITAKHHFRELVIMKNADHVNLMKAEETFTTQSSLKIFHNFYIVMEKMDCSLRQVVNLIGTVAEDGTSFKLSHEQVSFLGYQMLCGLQYLNRMGIIHRDLKPENMLVNERNMKLKISDFGKGLGLKGTLKDKLTSSAYTPYYAAPEQILDMVFVHNNEKMAVDMWSMGIIIAELFKGEILCQHKMHHLQWQAIVDKFGTPGPTFIARLPEAKQSFVKVSQMLYVPRPWNHTTMLPDRDDEPAVNDDRHSTDNLRDLVSKMLVVDPHRRMTVGQALRHPYVIKWYTKEEADAQPSVTYDASYEDRISTVEEWKEEIYRLLNKHIVDDHPSDGGSTSGGSPLTPPYTPSMTPSSPPPSHQEFVYHPQEAMAMIPGAATTMPQMPAPFPVTSWMHPSWMAVPEFLQGIFHGLPVWPWRTDSGPG